jgi:hypothetical protein
VLVPEINPSWDRTYTVWTAGGGTGSGNVIPSFIPAGAIIIANGVIEDATGHELTVNGILNATNAASSFEDIVKLTVNGELYANAASFENVETLLISSLNTDNLTSRASAGPTNFWTDLRGYLAADSATLKKAASIIIGDYGEFQSESIGINLPEGARISLGRSAIFDAAGPTNNSFDNLASLFIGPAAAVTIVSPAVTFKSLATLTMQDGASLVANAPGTAITYLVETTPSTPPKKTAMTFGLNADYRVRLDPTAKVDVALTGKSSLLGGSTLTVNEGSKFTLDAGAKLTVNTGASVDFSKIGTTLPTSTESAPVQINGTIELTGNNTTQLIIPNPGLFQTPTDLAKVVSFGSSGEIVMNYGTTSTLAYVPATGSSPAIPAVPYIGTGAAYTWATSDDGAQIIINAAGITIRDAKDSAPAVVTVAGPGAYILKEQTLYLDTNVELKVDTSQAIWLVGDATTGGAQLRGPGKVTAGNTTIIGGTNGWRVFGSESIGIRHVGAVTAEIVNDGTGTTTSFRALGPSAVITQAIGSGNALTIATNTLVELGGTATSPGGSIVLKSGTDPAQLAFGGTTTSKLLLGAGTGGTATGALVTLTIGGKSITNAGLASGDFIVLNDKLVILGGLTTGGITASTSASPANDVTIVSNAVFTNL